LGPDIRVTDGKVLKAKTPKVVSRVAAARRLAAQSLRSSEHQFGEDGRRMKARLGKAKGLTATAHKLARILYAVITRRVAYNEAEAFKQTPTTPARRISNLQSKPPNSVSNSFPPPNSTSCYSGAVRGLLGETVTPVIWMSAVVLESKYANVIG